MVIYIYIYIYVLKHYQSTHNDNMSNLKKILCCTHLQERSYFLFSGLSLKSWYLSYCNRGEYYCTGSSDTERCDDVLLSI